MNLEPIIELMLHVQKALRLLVAHYARLERVIDKEHAFIGKSDLLKLEGLLPEKEAVGNAILEQSGKLLKLQRNARSLIGDKISSDGLKGLMEAFTKVGEETRGEVGLRPGVVTRLERELRNDYQEFEQLFKKVHPRVEQNGYILSKLLKREQRLQRIWQETMEASEGVYDQKGHQNHQNPCSVLQVKA